MHTVLPAVLLSELSTGIHEKKPVTATIWRDPESIPPLGGSPVWAQYQLRARASEGFLLSLVAGQSHVAVLEGLNYTDTPSSRICF